MWASLLKNLGSFKFIKNVKNACAFLISLLLCRLNLCTVSLHREMAEWQKHSIPASLKRLFIFPSLPAEPFLDFIVICASHNQDPIIQRRLSSLSSFLAGKHGILLIANSIPGPAWNPF
jgi:hypothetical protein